MNWPNVALKAVASIEREGIGASLITAGQRYIGLEHILPSGEAQGIEVEAGDLASAKLSFTARHVLFGKLRPYLRKVAKPDFDGICSTDIVPILPGERLDRSYLFHFLRTDDVIAKASSLATGANLPRLSPRLLADFELPIPPLDEQRRIAAILDQADDLRRKRRTALERMEKLTRTIFKSMFVTDNARKTASLAQVCDLITDGTHQTPKYTEAGTIFLSSRNVTTGFINWKYVKYIPNSLHKELHARLAPRRNDVLLAKNGTTGIAALVDRDCIFDIYVSLALLRPGPSVIPEYLLAAVNSTDSSQQFKGALKGIGVSNLHLSDIRRTNIPLPSLDLQRAFAARVAEIDKLKASHRTHLAQLDALFASLQHRAFRGGL